MTTINLKSLLCREQKDTALSEIKIFAINDCEWWAGKDIESIKAAFIAEGYGDESSFCEPYEVSETDMSRLRYVEYLGNEQNAETFRERLDFIISRGDTFPRFFATTEI